MANRINKPRKLDYSPTAQDYEHKSWPAWFYGPNGQAQVFNGPLEVPEDWQDSPDKFDADGNLKKGAKTEVPGLDDALASSGEDAGEGGDRAGDPDIDLPPYDDITAKDIRAKLDELGVAYESDANKPRIYEMLRTALTEEA